MLAGQHRPQRDQRADRRIARRLDDSAGIGQRRCEDRVGGHHEPAAVAGGACALESRRFHHLRRLDAANGERIGRPSYCQIGDDREIDALHFAQLRNDVRAHLSGADQNQTNWLTCKLALPQSQIDLRHRAMFPRPFEGRKVRTHSNK